MSPLRETDDWKVETLRLTAFLSPDADFETYLSWADLVGEAPEQRNEEPRTGSLVEVGSFGRGVLRLSRDPLRFDWRYSTSSEHQDDLPSLGSPNEQLDLFVPLAQRWLGAAANVQRLAFGAILLLPVDGRAEGYHLLNKYLPNVTLEPDGSSDFLYRINRRRDSQAGPTGLKVNRLSTWSVSSFSRATIRLGPSVTASARVRRLASAMRLELDINTVAELEDELPDAALTPLFNELVDLGRELVEKGDIS